MIVQLLPGILRIAYQIDHADLSGQFTAHWGNALFARPMPLSSVQIASTQHDNGWRHWDLHPRVDPATGRPIDFMHMDVREHTDLNRKGIAEVMATDPYAGLLVNAHGCGLYNGRYGTMNVPGLERYSVQELPLVKAFLDEHEVKQQNLKEQIKEVNKISTEVFEQQFWTNYRWLQMWDRLSLYFCLQDLATAPVLTLGPLPTDYAGHVTDIQVISQGGNEIIISPYPFALPQLTFTFIVRDIPDCKYASDNDLRAALHTAVPQVMHFRAMSE
jgi:hypothetical protein